MLTIKNLKVSYKGIDAVRGVDLAVQKGEIVALIGANGAGKTSILNGISGIVPHGGSIEFSGENISGKAPYRISRSGLIQVPEGRRILAGLTVLENLLLGRNASGDRGTDASDLTRIYELFPILFEKREQHAGFLSGGQQQMLAIGRALMGRPRLLMLDEPSLGLAPVIVKEVFDGLKRLNVAGLTILLVEQNAKLALETANRAALIEQGRVVHSGAASELANNPVVVSHYLGVAT